jgi:hypothetical protein
MSREEVENALTAIGGCSDTRVTRALKVEVGYMLLAEHAQAISAKIGEKDWAAFVRRERPWFRKMRAAHL